jgi:predicted dehydrogenase
MLKIPCSASGFIADFIPCRFTASATRTACTWCTAANEDRLKTFCQRWNVPKSTTNLEEGVADPEVDVVIVSLPNNLHLESARLCAQTQKGHLLHQAAGPYGR